MINIYVYTFDTLADWEIGNVTAELNSKRFFKADAPEIAVKTVANSKNPIKTMGGLTILPDLTIDEMEITKDSVLILPGGNTWNEPIHGEILKKAAELLAANGTLCAICGATIALAFLGILDNRPHTSNGVGFLDMFVPTYKGKDFYVDTPSVADNNLITAAGTGAVFFAKNIIEHLGVFRPDTLDAWEKYYTTGKAEHFYALMGTLPNNGQN